MRMIDKNNNTKWKCIENRVPLQNTRKQNGSHTARRSAPSNDADTNAFKMRLYSWRAVWVECGTDAAKEIYCLLASRRFVDIGLECAHSNDSFSHSTSVSTVERRVYNRCAVAVGEFIKLYFRSVDLLFATQLNMHTFKYGWLIFCSVVSCVCYSHAPLRTSIVERTMTSILSLSNRTTIASIADFALHSLELSWWEKSMNVDWTWR